MRPDADVSVAGDASVDRHRAVIDSVDVVVVDDVGVDRSVAVEAAAAAVENQVPRLRAASRAELDHTRRIDRNRAARIYGQALGGLNEAAVLGRHRASAAAAVEGRPADRDVVGAFPRRICAGDRHRTVGARVVADVVVKAVVRCTVGDQVPAVSDGQLAVALISDIERACDRHARTGARYGRNPRRTCIGAEHELVGLRVERAAALDSERAKRAGVLPDVQIGVGCDALIDDSARADRQCPRVRPADLQIAVGVPRRRDGHPADGAIADDRGVDDGRGQRARYRHRRVDVEFLGDAGPGHIGGNVDLGVVGRSRRPARRSPARSQAKIRGA